MPRSPPPSYTTIDSHPPSNYRPGASRSSRNTPSRLSNTISSTSEPDFASRSETSTSRSTSSTSYPSPGSSSPSSPSSSRNHHHHTHFHNHNHTSHNTYDGLGRSRSANNFTNVGPSTPEATPLLRKPTNSDSSISREKEEMYARRWIGGIILILVVLHWRSLQNFFFKKSDLTSFWVEVTPSETCHAVGVREYTATLVGIPEDWDPITACQATPFIVHGKAVEEKPSCSIVSAANDVGGSLTAVQGRFFVNFDESDCYPIWSTIHPDDCVVPGVRLYHAEIDYVPPGLDRLESCRGVPSVFHGRELHTSRCELVFKHGEGGQNDSLVARGEWDVDFDEDGCLPSWAPLVTQQCVSYGTRAYYADLVVPRGLENIAPTLCSSSPAVIHTHTVLPTYCEQLGEASFRGHWTIDFSESSCEAVWMSVNPDWQCHAYDKKRYTAILERIPEELDPLKTCYEAPLSLFGVQRTPELCDRDDQGRVVGSWFVGGPECRPVLFDIRDYGCIESGIKRVEGQVGDIGKHEDWYRLCSTIPHHRYGQTYLPVQCESRTSWFKTRRYAMYNIPDSRCL
ncbi:hypothetical protein D9758_013886 [Tetrapyrgos nigripes]|uniref:Uncharacterized protein n=1 Tax=Tetrapyrgos nigripes TaxID=182062 RepID=A0A8H5CMQ2_9AGAR|nr:hypothetical protein D9758_013886 [Tetrapyrgos nigripes]